MGCRENFFVKQVKLILDCHNPHIGEINPQVIKIVRELIKRIANKELELTPFVTVYYDAWLNDNDDDPILSLIYSILKHTDSDFNFTESHNIWGVVSSIFDAISGKQILSSLSGLRGKDLLESLRSKKEFDSLVTEFLCSLLPEKGNRLIVFIDELDRCRPEYAVRLLERIKHYFLDDRITFVFSVNMGELQHAIKHHYGNDFDACRYLDRFFDLRLDLPPANYEYFYCQIGMNSNYFYESVCRAVTEQYKFSLRETAKFFRLAKTAAHKATHDSWYNSFDNASMLFSYIVPLVIGIKFDSQSKYMSFINGADGTPLFDFFSNYPDLSMRICQRFFSVEPNASQSELLEIAKQFYDAVFCETYAEKRSRTVYGLEIYREHRDKFIRMANAFSEHADYEI